MLFPIAPTFSLCLMEKGTQIQMVALANNLNGFSAYLAFGLHERAVVFAYLDTPSFFVKPFIVHC